MKSVTIPLMRNTFLFAFVVDAIVTLRLFAEPTFWADSRARWPRWAWRRAEPAE